MPIHQSSDSTLTRRLDVACELCSTAEKGVGTAAASSAACAGALLAGAAASAANAAGILQNALWAAGQCQPWEYQELLEQPCLLPHLRQLASVLLFRAVVEAAPLVAAAAAL